MFTASADHHGQSDESMAGVAISAPAARGPGSRPARTSLTIETLDLRDRAGRRGDQHDIDLDVHADPDELDPGELDPDELDLTELFAGEDDWTEEAACKGRTNLFFGRAGERPERRIRRERSAGEVCAACPVAQPCRDRARAGRENGFWGGESEEERAAAGFPPRSVSRRSVQRASAVGAAS